MASIQVIGLDQAMAGVRNLPKQAKFALTQAVNETAKAVQTHTVSNLLPSRFTLRAKGAPWQKPGTRMGFNIKFAKRSQAQPEAIIGSRADWLTLQEQGGIKDTANSVAIPTTFHKARQEVLARNKRPKAIARKMQGRDAARRHRELKDLEAAGATYREIGWQKIRNTKESTRIRVARASLRNTPFYLGGFNTPEGHAFPSGWWVRTSRERLPIRPLFFFHETTRVPAHMEFIPTETKVANDHLVLTFHQAMQRAIKTAK